MSGLGRREHGAGSERAGGDCASKRRQGMAASRREQGKSTRAGPSRERLGEQARAVASRDKFNPVLERAGDLGLGFCPGTGIIQKAFGDTERIWAAIPSVNGLQGCGAFP
jgi:hypothetical protein